MLRKFPAHLHALDIKDAQTQRDPGIEQLEGMRKSKLENKYMVKRNKILNQCTLLRSQGEEGVLLYLDKVEKIIRACNKLLLTWKTHGPPLGDCKVKETMYRTISKTADEIEQLRDNSSTDDTLTSLTLIKTCLDGISVMDSAILVEEDQDWEKVDDEDSWVVNYTEPTTEIKEKIEFILHTWGWEHSEEEQDDMRKLNPERERFLVPYACKDPEIMKIEIWRTRTSLK